MACSRSGSCSARRRRCSPPVPFRSRTIGAGCRHSRRAWPASPEALVAGVDQQRPGGIAGDRVPTGFPSVGRLLGGGLRRRGLIVLGGDVGSGKSALALGIALRVAQQEGGPGVAFFSGEMDEERLMERALAVEGRVAVDELRAAKLSDQTRAEVGGAAGLRRGLPA